MFFYLPLKGKTLYGDCVWYMWWERVASVERGSMYLCITERFALVKLRYAVLRDCWRRLECGRGGLFWRWGGVET